MAKDKSQRTCFVITPLNSPDSVTRKKVDSLIGLIRDSLSHKYKVFGPHEIDEPGSITTQIIEHLHKDDLVIANLTEVNGNVMYELALRHAFRKPVIIIAEEGTRIPFDIKDDRVIIFTDDLAGATKLRDSLVEFSAYFDDEKNEIKNPVYRFLKEEAIQQVKLPESSDELLLEKIDDLITTKLNDSGGRSSDLVTSVCIELKSSQEIEKIKPLNNRLHHEFAKMGVYLTFTVSQEGKSPAIIMDFERDSFSPNRRLDLVESIIERELRELDITPKLLSFSHS